MIPLIAKLLPLVPALVRGVEGIFVKRSPEDKRGTEKRDAVLAALMGIAQVLAQKGDTIKQDEILGMIETVVQQEKQEGDTKVVLRFSNGLFVGVGEN